jgi:nucleotide-binding universal stress UspA family protein
VDFERGGKTMQAQPWKPNKILVATDFLASAEAALREALWLAERCGAVVTVAHVLSDMRQAMCDTPAGDRQQLVTGDIEAFERAVRRTADERLKELLAPYRQGPVEMHYETLLGVPFVEIIHAVHQERHDLVVAGTQGASGWKRFMVGSTAERLVRKCPCPVWIVKAGQERPVRTVLVPVDFSAVSSKALELAGSLAAQAGARLVVLHVVEVPAEEAFDILEPVLPQTAEADTETAAGPLHHEAGQRLREFARSHVDPALAAETWLSEGAAWHAIDSAARRLNVDLIVMGSLARTGIPGLLIGNTAEKVMRSCDRSLLTVKPDGFVSPIQPPCWSLHPQQASDSGPKPSSGE